MLEDGLRRLALAQKIAVKADDDLGALDTKLAQKGVYSALERKRVRLWNGIPNSADHGKWDELREPDVREMPTGVRDFLARYLRL